jgi:hypothetical protein
MMLCHQFLMICEETRKQSKDIKVWIKFSKLIQRYIFKLIKISSVSKLVNYTQKLNPIFAKKA